MNRVKSVIKTAVGALGWGLLGGLMVQLGIGPCWLAWSVLMVSGTIIAIAMDKALSPNSYGGYK